jgi:hypothetical protein
VSNFSRDLRNENSRHTRARICDQVFVIAEYFADRKNIFAREQTSSVRSRAKITRGPRAGGSGLPCPSRLKPRCARDPSAVLQSKASFGFQAFSVSFTRSGENDNDYENESDLGSLCCCSCRAALLFDPDRSFRRRFFESQTHR